jgi:hypothetical protein
LTNGTNKFYGYIGFGLDNAKTNKIIYLPEGWKISDMKQPNATVLGKWDVSTEFNQITGESGMDNTNGYFNFTNSSGETSKYSKWIITGFTAVDSVKVTIEKKS